MSETRKVLTLHLTKEWFMKIAWGEKTEEYRDISTYWTNRLLSSDAPKRKEALHEVGTLNRPDIFMQAYLYDPYNEGKWKEVIGYTHVEFVLGYPKGGYPSIERRIEEILVAEPKQGMCPDEWRGKLYYTIRFKDIDESDVCCHTSTTLFYYFKHKRVLYKGKDIGAYLAGYTEDGKYLILGFEEEDKGCIKSFSKSHNIVVPETYPSYRFAKVKYVKPVESE